MKLDGIVQKHQAKHHGGHIEPLFVVMHHTAGRFPGDLHTLQGFTGRQVSCHCYINKKGHAFQILDTNLKGYHAGESRWAYNGVIWKYLNGYSIGVELENLDGNKHPYPGAQIDSLCNKLVPAIVAAHPILADPARWIGHQDVSPVRKIDPGKLFPWAKLRAAVSAAGK